MTIAFSDAFRGARVLLTGHTGFKGAWLALWLETLGADVVGFSDGEVSTPSLFGITSLSSRIRHELGDIRDRVRLGALVKAVRPDYVFHLAAQPIVSASYVDPFETFGVNVMGTAALLEALKQADWPVASVIVTTDKVYRNREWAWGYRESDELGGKDPYSGSKGAAELVFRSYHESFFSSDQSAVRIASARAGNVIGGGDWAKDRIVPDCMRAWQAGGQVQLRRPESTRPWQHVLEPLGAYLCLAANLRQDAGFNGQSFNFGPPTAQNVTVIEVLSNLAAIWGFTEQSQYVSTELQAGTFREAGLLRLSIEKAAAELSWHPILSIDEAIRLTGEWYRRVLLEKADALDVTLGQIGDYQQLAERGGSSWFLGAPRTA